MLAAGTQLGPYKIFAPLGAGGMGEVYRARATRLARDFALKVVRGDLTPDPERHKRFELESRAVGALNHPNVCTILDVGTHDGAPFVVMELLEGEFTHPDPDVRHLLDDARAAVQRARATAGPAAQRR